MQAGEFALEWFVYSNQIRMLNFKFKKTLLKGQGHEI